MKETQRKLPQEMANDNGSRRLTLREEQKLFTRDRLLDAALKVFREVGYRPATIDQITEEAGANRTTFYLHFKDKLDLAVGLGRRASLGTRQKFIDLDNMVNPSVSDIRNWLVDTSASVVKDPVMGQIINEALAAERTFSEEYLLYMSQLANLMTNYLSPFSGKQRSIARSKLVLVQLLIGRFNLTVYAQGLNFPGEYAVDALAESVWSILFAPPLKPNRVDNRKTKSSDRLMPTDVQ